MLSRWFTEEAGSDLEALRREHDAQYARTVAGAVLGPYGDNDTLYAATADLVKTAHFPETKLFASQAVLRFIERCEELHLSTPHDAILIQMGGTAAGLYVAEQLSVLPPNPGKYFVHNANATMGMMRDMLLRQQMKCVDPTATLRGISDALVASYLVIMRHLPSLALEGGVIEGVPTIPLFDLLPNVGAVIEEALAPFFVPNEIGLFRWFTEKLKHKIERVAEKARSKQLIAPSEYQGSPREIFDAYVDDTPFDRIFNARIPFDISMEDRGEHTAIVAGSGWGKTQLLQSIIAGDLADYEDPPAIVVIDSTGAMVQRIQRLAIFNEHLRDRLLIIDPELDPVPALNPFDISNARFSTYDESVRERMQGEVIDLFNYVFSTVKNPLSTRMETAFAFMVRLLLSIPGANIHTLLDLLNDEPAKGNYAQAVFKPHIDQLDATTQLFFKAQYYTGRDGGLREQIRARVFDILRVPAFERMFSTVNKVDFFTELNRGAIVLVNTSENLLKDGSTTFGRYIIARVMAAAFERAPIPPDDRRQAFLIVDEAAPYFDEQFEKLLNRVRQFKLGVVIAFQNLEQASEKLRSTIASSTAVKYAGGAGANDARWLAREMRCDPEFILAQKRDARPPKWTQFACHVRNFTDRAVSLTVPFFAIENMPKMSDAEHAQLLKRNHARVAATPDVPRPAAIVSTVAEPAPQQVPMNPIAKAYADLAAAINRADWAAVAELKNDIIPALERQVAGEPAPKPVPPRPETPPSDGGGEAADDWR